MTANQINMRNAIENARHNAQMEQLQRSANAETFRHNVEMEKENRRHNVSSESSEVRKNVEASRHNRETEVISEAYNVGNLAVARTQAEIASRNADTNAINAQTNRYGYELSAAKYPYEMAETQSRTSLNRTSEEMKPYETGVKIVDTISHFVGVLKPKKGK